MVDEEKPPLPPITRQDVLWVAKQGLSFGGCLFLPVVLLLAVAVAVTVALRGAFWSWLNLLLLGDMDWKRLRAFPFRSSDWHWLTPYLWHPFGWSPVPWALGIPLVPFLAFFLLRRPLAYMSHVLGTVFKKGGELLGKTPARLRLIRRPLAYIFDVAGIVFNETGEVLGNTPSRVRLVFVLSLSVCGLLATVSLFLSFAYATISSGVYFVVEQQLPEKRRADLRVRTIKQLEDWIILTPIAMRLGPPPVLEWRDSAEDDQPLVVECGLHSRASRTVTEFSGNLEAYDRTGELIANVYRVEHAQPLRPGEGRKLELEFPAYSHLKTVAYEEIVWQWHPTQARLDDGTTLIVDPEPVGHATWFL